MCVHSGTGPLRAVRSRAQFAVGLPPLFRFGPRKVEVPNGQDVWVGLIAHDAFAQRAQRVAIERLEGDVNRIVIRVRRRAHQIYPKRVGKKVDIDRN